ncbi:hypothetical protein GIW56_22910 [Pseudomonas gessardii]|uniref:Head-tail adaptor protein n=1 Tax=Pseudomonas gessardii TaxID=78544 RepID=A0ABS9FE55_9PSED|nr:hypothetical protein [Pseudomonas gessardii]MCF4980747.1 hypothetical protein [Pseudomonas gessardii]MCF4988466.1 hypothetical protein [Pseudomonas gessardii]MCF5097391.1 hypothetical protein [Pseudomonas gessardii]MCF5109684.1 hypothetical protein [Pseudomonas gessardii]
MIGADDLADFFDADEFGTVIVVTEQDKPPRDVPGIIGTPLARGSIFRAGIDPGAAQVRVLPDQVQVQVANKDVPRPHQGVKVLVSGRHYVIAETAPIGRLRTLLTMTPDGQRTPPTSELGKWAVSN